MHLKSITVVVILLGVAGGVWLWQLGGSQPDAPTPATELPERVDARPPAMCSAPTERQPESRNATDTVAVDAVDKPHPHPGPALPEDAIPGEYVFSFYDAHDRAAFAAIANRLAGVRVLDRMALGYALRVAVNDEATLQTLLARSPTALDWMPNIEVRIPQPATSPEPVPLGGYQAFGAKALSWLGVADNRGWGAGVTVAVLDSGVAASAAFRDTTVSQLDLVGDGDIRGVHGTAVASIIAGSGETVWGIAPGVDLLSVKVISDTEAGDAFTLSKGIMEAVDRGAGVINVSLGSHSDSAMLQMAVRYALDRDVVLVAAAGNDGAATVAYPAAYDGVLAVAAVDAEGRHLAFSNQGAAIDLSAPGAGVNVADPDGAAVLFSGTSAATPFVAGAAAALLAREPGMNPADVAALLTRYSNDAGAPGVDDAYGAGVLDVGRLTERNTVGVYDMAVMIPHVRDDTNAARLVVDVAAQNRGTEPLARVRLEVVRGDRRQTFRFAEVEVGDTIAHAFTFPVESPGAVRFGLQVAVVPVGVTDVTPDNNALGVVIGTDAAR